MERVGLSFTTKFGWVTVEAVGDKLVRLYLSNKELSDRSHLLLKLKRDLTKYFEGKKVNFEKYKVDLSRYTKFERKVLNATKKLKYGETVSYSGLAEKIGHPNAQRAVGSVMAKNDVPIIIPCHRVVATNGIGGFAGGVDLKRRLLALENVRI